MSSRKTARLASAILALGIFAFLTLFFQNRIPLFQAAPLPIPAEQPEPKPKLVTYDRYGIEQGRFEVQEAKIARNQTFAQILSSHAVPYEQIMQLADAARPVFDVRDLRAGNTYHVYQDAASGATRYLVYERDPIRYVVFQLGDSLDVFEGRRPVEVKQRTVGGPIDGSVYATLDAQGADPRLATLLSEVFAWQIDFFRLLKGDAFSVVYEEQFVDDRPIGVGRILAARFEHAGHTYNGILFEEGDQAAYYDEEGNSLRRAFLKAPLKYERISSRYTLKRFHPVQKRWKAHLGTDYAAAPGTPIYAVGDGVVLEAGRKQYNGNYVKIRHNATYTTGYLHMSRIAPDVRPGARVKQGQVIGYVGSTGLATGPHLCFRFWKNGQQVDPLKEEFPSANPIDPRHRPAFERQRDAMMALLDPVIPPALAAGEPAPDRAAL